MDRLWRGLGRRLGVALAAVMLASCVAGAGGGGSDEETEGATSELLAGCWPPLCPRYRFVDLRPHQTGFRSQGGRDTCTVFATTAAVEAAYKRIYGLDLDLSEQFLHHFQKSFWLALTQPLPGVEIQPET